MPAGYGAHARREIIEEALSVGHRRARPGVDDDAEVLTAAQPAFELVERDDARRLFRQKLFEIAPQVREQPTRAPRRGDTEEERDDP